jgi:hypothetical protein
MEWSRGVLFVNPDAPPAAIHPASRRPSPGAPVQEPARYETAAARWYAEERAVVERQQRVPGTLPTGIALLPLIVLALTVRLTTPPAPEATRAEPELLLEVLATDTGYRLRLTDVAVEGWPQPQRADGGAPLEQSRQTYVYRIAGQDPSASLLAAARDLLRGSGQRPRIWLRGEDQVPWEQLLVAGEALTPLRGDADRIDQGLLARVSVDARP